ncbi:MAG: HAD family hydrolase [Phycisphaerae bacterium]
MSLQAVIFDFDGVIVDSEPLHFKGFQEVLKQIGIDLSREAYYSHYLGYDDHDCFAMVLAERGEKADEDRVAELTRRKTLRMQALIGQSIEPLPGAVPLIRALAENRTPMAICSGALGHEIRQAAGAVGVVDFFPIIVSAEDVCYGKPDPEGYLQALDKLGRLHPEQSFSAGRCVVIEDSPFGIEAGKAAGMRVQAVATSYPASDLTEADRVIESLAQLGPADLARLVEAG